MEDNFQILYEEFTYKKQFHKLNPIHLKNLLSGCFFTTLILKVFQFIISNMGVKLETQQSSISWFKEPEISWIERFSMSIIKLGTIPRHIAVIMDGNRRWAKLRNMDSKIGYMKGFDTVLKALSWGRYLGMKELSVFAFSIENFKRPKEEVDFLMTLADEKFSELLSEKKKLVEGGLCIRFVGNLEYLSNDLQKTMAEIMLLTKNNTNFFLNIYISYTARFEIASSVNIFRNSLKANEVKLSDCTPSTLNECMFSHDIPAPDILIRTSGEIRFSDYMLWQSNECFLHFTLNHWPEITSWDLLKVLLDYQIHYSRIKKIVKHSNEQKSIKKFVKLYEYIRQKEMLLGNNKSRPPPVPEPIIK